MPARKGTMAAVPSIPRRAALLIGAMLLSSLPTIPLLALNAHATGPVGGTYHALNPTRILDTRNGTGGFPVGPLGGAASIDVPLAGQGGVPSTGVSAVVLNVTATNTTAPSFLTL